MYTQTQINFISYLCFFDTNEDKPFPTVININIAKKMRMRFLA